jgi:hypothetical protein
MLYWLPVLFIIGELIFLNYIDQFVAYINANKLLVKYKDEKLEKYLKSKYVGIVGIAVFISIFLIAEFIYFIVGIFHPIWVISVVYLGIYVLTTVISKINGEQSIEKTVKKAKLIDFESSDIKLQRVLKLNELKSNEVKTRDWINYIYPIIKIIVFTAIVVLHYQYKML